MRKIRNAFQTQNSAQKLYLPDGESNPGLPRDRRGSLPLDYRGLVVRDSFCALLFSFLTFVLASIYIYIPQIVSSWPKLCLTLVEKRCGKSFSFEPDLNQRPMDFCSASNYSPPLYQLSYRRKIPLHHYYLQLDMSLQYTSSSRASAAFLKLDIVVLGCDFSKIQTPKGSGWPSGLRRCVQVAVHFCGRGFESHFWQHSFLTIASYWEAN